MRNIWKPVKKNSLLGRVQQEVTALRTVWVKYCIRVWSIYPHGDQRPDSTLTSFTVSCSTPIPPFWRQVVKLFPSTLQHWNVHSSTLEHAGIAQRSKPCNCRVQWCEVHVTKLCILKITILDSKFTVIWHLPFSFNRKILEIINTTIIWCSYCAIQEAEVTLNGTNICLTLFKNKMNLQASLKANFQMQHRQK